MKQPRTRLHPAIPELQSQLQQGTLSRREFLRLATLLGASAASAYTLAACGGAGETPPADSGSTNNGAAPQRGGTLKVGSLVPQLTDSALDHPARLSWIELANQLRQVGEYLTETRPDNTTRPWLLEGWEPSDDVQTWTLFVRQGVTFNDGSELTADDVIFSFEQWLDPAVGSSVAGLLSYLQPQNIERVDDYTIRLYLDKPQIAVPEHLFHYPALVLPRSFAGDYIHNPVGTGPFTLEAYVPGERVVFRRREDYWRMGADALPLPYLDSIEYIHLEPDQRVAAMQAGLVDTIFQPRATDLQALEIAPNIMVERISSALTLVLRMRTDRPPWNDERVRMALKLCQDRQRILDVTFAGLGEVAADAHVAPAHPSYCEQVAPPYDPERARALLAEAGYPNGLQATLTTKNDQAEPDMARMLRDLAQPAGFTLDLNILEPSRYWEQWKEVDLGITIWVHRPLATMTLALAYTADAQGIPVDWNETRWIDDEFNALLSEAERTLDVEERRAIMCQLQQIMQERGPVGISYWQNVWVPFHNAFRNVQAHPSSYDLFYAVWKEA